MNNKIPSAGGLRLLLLGCVVLAGCASQPSGPAPIVDRNAARGNTAPAAVAPAAVELGYHIVQRGETLYSLARQYGQDPKNIIIWNRLENPNAISPGQRVRVAPPSATPTAVGAPGASDVAEVRPIAPVGGVESRPLAVTPLPATPLPDGASPPAATGSEAKPGVAAADAIKREPRGGKVPYSEQAWAKAQGLEDKPATNAAAGTAAAPTAAGSAAESKPAAKADGKTDSAPVAAGAVAGAGENKAAEAKSAADGLDWGWPNGGKVVTGYSDASNKGIDIGGKLGDPVVAAASGKVLYAGQDLRGYGKLVVVKHANQYLSVYAHNSEILVKEGQSVSKGQKIAELGKSDAQEPKLHFEIRRQGKPVDPMQYLPSR